MLDNFAFAFGNLVCAAISHWRIHYPEMFLLLFFLNINKNIVTFTSLFAMKFLRTQGNYFRK